MCAFKQPSELEQCGLEELAQVSKQYQEVTNPESQVRFWPLPTMPPHSMPSVQWLCSSELLVVRNLNYNLCLFFLVWRGSAWQLFDVFLLSEIVSGFCLANVYWVSFWHTSSSMRLNSSKQAPGTSLSQALEELSHGLVVQAIGTVEDNTLKHNKTT